jgi:hypothetical protein
MHITIHTQPNPQNLLLQMRAHICKKPRIDGAVAAEYRSNWIWSGRRVHCFQSALSNAMRLMYEMCLYCFIPASIGWKWKVCCVRELIIGRSVRTRRERERLFIRAYAAADKLLFCAAIGAGVVRAQPPASHTYTLRGLCTHGGGL